jgi:hypothetical protein
MNLLNVFCHPFQQRRCRVTKMLAEFVQDELDGDSPVARPALWWKHAEFLGVLFEHC